MATTGCSYPYSPSCLDLAFDPSSPRRSPSFNRNSNMLDNLRRKFSKSGVSSTSERTSTTSSRSLSFRSKSTKPAQMDNSNPFTSDAPPTRRPNRPGMNAFTTPSNEPPPAYTPNPPPINMSAVEATNINSSAPADATDNQYSFLSTFDTKFLIDDSGSMAGRSWRETRQAIEAFAPISTKYDVDGIDIHFLNDPNSYLNVKRASDVTEIFTTVRPQGGTPTGQRLNRLLKPYLADAARDLDGTKPLSIIVITDGAPSDDVESVIINAAKKLDKMDAPSWQVGIQFFQVGNEPDAREYLKQLDDGLAELAGDDGLRDMVDTVPFREEFTAQLMLKCLLGATVRRLDRKSIELPSRQ